jgi:hypothetical protein
MTRCEKAEHNLKARINLFHQCNDEAAYTADKKAEHYHLEHNTCKECDALGQESGRVECQ